VLEALLTVHKAIFEDDQPDRDSSAGCRVVFGDLMGDEYQVWSAGPSRMRPVIGTERGAALNAMPSWRNKASFSAFAAR
jgi:hypothetical protein